MPVDYNNLPQNVLIREVGPREGFQSEKKIIPTDEKVKFINKLLKTGIKRIQVTAFVHPKYVPNMGDAEEVLSRIEKPAGVKIAVLIPNEKGAERAAKIKKADEWNLMLSISDSHSMANANCTTKEALKRQKDIIKIARESGVDVAGGMGTALGCPFEGRIPLSRMFEVVDAYQNINVNTIGVADTSGMADPRHVYMTMKALIERYPNVKFKMHLHNTRGMGLANVIAALQAGVSYFDASVGGLGGCPFAPGASGNIATEDLAHMLDNMGINTGIDIKAVNKIAQSLPEMLGHPIDSFLARAGTSDELHDLVTAKKAGDK